MGVAGDVQSEVADGGNAQREGQGGHPVEPVHQHSHYREEHEQSQLGRIKHAARISLDRAGFHPAVNTNSDNPQLERFRG